MIEPPPTDRRAEYGEVLCAIGALSFVITRCWIGYGIAVNGAIAHGLSQRCRHAKILIAFDTVCNAGFIAFGLATDPVVGNWIAAAIIAHGLAISTFLSESRPFVSRLVHFACVQIPAFCAVYVWCRCCDPFFVH